jgi:hypothetical protein
MEYLVGRATQMEPRQAERRAWHNIGQRPRLSEVRSFCSARPWKTPSAKIIRCGCCDEILRGLDWSEWVTPCTDHRGRPPIHPSPYFGGGPALWADASDPFQPDAGIYVQAQRGFHLAGRRTSARPHHAFRVRKEIRQGPQGAVSPGGPLGDGHGLGSVMLRTSRRRRPWMLRAT